VRVAGIDVRAITPSNATAWLELRHALWPDEGRAEHATEIEAFFAGALSNPLHVLMAFEDGRPIGFAEVNIRPYAEGCTTDRVGFLEGWYVVPEARRRGVGAALVEAAERWALAQGCTEFASDAQYDNQVSQRAHLALGFDEVEQLRCFRKELRPGS
jgi:aminoglycoside 6'-N-acetyltransferase I